jgi:DNA-binding HxlR family transcriptional regulator
MKQTFTCPVELALDMLGGKWRTVILANIKEGALRYADLRRRIPRMSEKMLTQRLRELVETGLVAHEADTYLLTPRGERARVVLTALHAWGESLVPELGVHIEPPALQRSEA